MALAVVPRHGICVSVMSHQQLSLTYYLDNVSGNVHQSHMQHCSSKVKRESKTSKYKYHFLFSLTHGRFNLVS